MKKVVHFEVHFVILYSKTELLKQKAVHLFLFAFHDFKAPKASTQVLKIRLICVMAWSSIIT